MIMLPICTISLRAFLLGLLLLICSLLATKADLFFAGQPRKPEPVLLQTSFGGNVDEIASELETLLLAALANDTEVQESELSDAIRQYHLVEEEKLDNVDVPYTATSVMRDVGEAYEMEKMQQGKTEPNLKNETEVPASQKPSLTRDKPVSDTQLNQTEPSDQEVSHVKVTQHDLLEDEEEAAAQQLSMIDEELSSKPTLQAEDEIEKLNEYHPEAPAVAIDNQEFLMIPTHQAGPDIETKDDGDTESPLDIPVISSFIMENQEPQENSGIPTHQSEPDLEENQETQVDIQIPTHQAVSDQDPMSDDRKVEELKLPTIATSIMETQEMKDDSFMVPTYQAEVDLESQGDDRAKEDQKLPTIATSIMQNQETVEDKMTPTHQAESDLDPKSEEQEFPTIAISIMQNQETVEDFMIPTHHVETDDKPKGDDHTEEEQKLPIIATAVMDNQETQEDITIPTHQAETDLDRSYKAVTDLDDDRTESEHEPRAIVTTPMESVKNEQGFVKEQDSAIITTSVTQEFPLIGTTVMESGMKLESNDHNNGVEQDFSKIATAIMETPLKTEDQEIATTTMESPEKTEDKNRQIDQDLPIFGTTIMESPIKNESYEQGVQAIGTTIMKSPEESGFGEKDSKVDPDTPMTATTMMEKADDDIATIGKTIMESPVDLGRKSAKEADQEQQIIATTTMELPLKAEEINEVDHELPTIATTVMETLFRHPEAYPEPTYTDHGLREHTKPLRSPALLYDWIEPTKEHYDGIDAVAVVIPTVITEEDEREIEQAYMPIATMMAQAYNPDIAERMTSKLPMDSEEHSAKPTPDATVSSEGHSSDITATMGNTDYEWLAEKTIEQILKPESKGAVEATKNKSVRFATLPSTATMEALEEPFATMDSQMQRSYSDFDDNNELSPSRPGSIMLWAVKHTMARKVPQRRSYIEKHPKASVY